MTIDEAEKHSYSKDIKIEIPPIYFSTQKENNEIIKLLLMNDNIDANMRYESTLFGSDADDQWANCIKKASLHLAIEKANIELINMFLANEKIDVNIWCKTGDFVTNSWGTWKEKTPLSIAIKKDNKEIIKLLLMNDRIDVNKVICYFGDRNRTICNYNVFNYAEYIDQITRQLFQ